MTPNECRTSSEEREDHRQLEDQGYEFYGEQGKGKNDEASEGDQRQKGKGKGKSIEGTAALSPEAALNELLMLEKYYQAEGLL